MVFTIKIQGFFHELGVFKKMNINGHVYHIFVTRCLPFHQDRNGSYKNLWISTEIFWWNLNIFVPFLFCQMLHVYGIFTNIYPKNQPNVGKYTIHGAYGFYQKI